MDSYVNQSYANQIKTKRAKKNDPAELPKLDFENPYPNPIQYNEQPNVQ